MEKGTIDNDITLKYNSDNENLVVSTSSITEKQLANVSNKAIENESKINTVNNKVTDMSNRVNENDSKINTLRNELTDLSNDYTTLRQDVFVNISDIVTELHALKENSEAEIKKLSKKIKTLEIIFIVSFSLIILNCFYVICTLMKKG